MVLRSVDATPDIVHALKKRRVLFKLQRVCDIVTLLSEPADSEINLLQNALELILKQCAPDLSDIVISVCSFSLRLNRSILDSIFSFFFFRRSCFGRSRFTCKTFEIRIDASENLRKSDF